MQIKSATKNQSARLILRGLLTTTIVTALLAPVSQVVSAGSVSDSHKLSPGEVMAPQNNVLDSTGLIKPPRIQLAIVLDTSNSMDGLIDQTRNQLWQVVNEFSSARQDGVAPQVTASCARSVVSRASWTRFPPDYSVS